MDAPTAPDAPDLVLARESLRALGRCVRTGGILQCGGHWDYFSSYMVWTRHFVGRVAYRVVPYTHCAPEACAVSYARYH